VVVVSLALDLLVSCPFQARVEDLSCLEVDPVHLVVLPSLDQMALVLGHQVLEVQVDLVFGSYQVVDHQGLAWDLLDALEVVLACYLQALDLLVLVVSVHVEQILPFRVPYPDHALGHAAGDLDYDHHHFAVALLFLLELQIS